MLGSAVPGSVRPDQLGSAALALISSTFTFDVHLLILDFDFRFPVLLCSSVFFDVIRFSLPFLDFL